MDWATIPESLQAQRQPKLVGRILWFAPPPPPPQVIHLDLLDLSYP